MVRRQDSCSYQGRHQVTQGLRTNGDPVVAWGIPLRASPARKREPVVSHHDGAVTKLWAVVIFIGRSSRRIAVTVVGATLVLLGLAGVVLPVIPGPLLIIGGLALLATEYVWARRALAAAKRKASQARSKVRERRALKRGARPEEATPGDEGPNIWR